MAADRAHYEWESSPDINSMPVHNKDAPPFLPLGDAALPAPVPGDKIVDTIHHLQQSEEMQRAEVTRLSNMGRNTDSRLMVARADGACAERMQLEDAVTVDTGDLALSGVCEMFTTGWCLLSVFWSFGCWSFGGAVRPSVLQHVPQHVQQLDGPEHFGARRSVV